MKSLLLCFGALMLMATPSCCLAQCANGQCSINAVPSYATPVMGTLSRSYVGPLGLSMSFQRPAVVSRTLSVGYVPSYARTHYVAPAASYGSQGGGSEGNYSGRVRVYQRTVVRQTTSYGSYGG